MPPSESLFIVFHDGYVGNYEVAYPLLKEYGLKATFLLPTDFIGSRRRFWVDVLDAALKHTQEKSLILETSTGSQNLKLDGLEDRVQASHRLRAWLKTKPLPEFENEFGKLIQMLGFGDEEEIPRLGDFEACMTWEMVREMSQSGMRFGSHTHGHVICARQDAPTVREEMAISKARIERETGQPCDIFCYPNGTYPNDGNDKTDQLALEAGYDGVLYMGTPFNVIRSRTFRFSASAYRDGTQEARLKKTLSRRRYYWKKLRGIRIWPWERDSLDINGAPPGVSRGDEGTSK